jgi:hypothetical protein
MNLAALHKTPLFLYAIAFFIITLLNKNPEIRMGGPGSQCLSALTI